MALLYETLDNNIYIKILTSFKEFNKVYKLNKALYNLK